MDSENRTENGFTLLEVLVAFVILSASLVAANQSLSYSLRAFTSAKMSRAADRVAEEIFAERFGLASSPHAENGTAADGLQWELKREPFALGSGNADVLAEKLTLEVTAPTNGRIVRRYVTYHSAQKNEDDNAR